IVDGPLNILNSSFRTGEDEFTITIPANLKGEDFTNSLSLNLTSEGSSLVLPLILLSTHIGPYLVFTSGSLDQEVVRIGLFINDRVSGQVTLEGFALASLVYIAFRAESGTWVNLTLSSGTGVYTFDYSPSNFQLGSHQVYAIAIGQDVPSTEMNFATLTVVQDYTIVTVGAVALIAGVVIYVMKQRREGGPE
ncbi:MAG: hypothetical protein ACFFEE_10010, partial [Candidatus Thorarchaeota archaeon]